jgi:hypothetical protein
MIALEFIAMVYLDLRFPNAYPAFVPIFAVVALVTAVAENLP